MRPRARPSSQPQAASALPVTSTCPISLRAQPTRCGPPRSTWTTRPGAPMNIASLNLRSTGAVSGNEPSSARQRASGSLWPLIGPPIGAATTAAFEIGHALGGGVTQTMAFATLALSDRRPSLSPRGAGRAVGGIRAWAEHPGRRTSTIHCTPIPGADGRTSTSTVREALRAPPRSRIVRRGPPAGGAGSGARRRTPRTTSPTYIRAGPGTSWGPVAVRRSCGSAGPPATRAGSSEGAVSVSTAG